MEKRYYNRNGDVVWALLAVSLVRHTDGTPLYFIAQIEDINELKRTEQVNQQLMERITLANEAGGIGIWEWELKPNILAGISGCSSCMKFLHISNRTGRCGTSACCRKIASMPKSDS